MQLDDREMSLCTQVLKPKKKLSNFYFYFFVFVQLTKRKNIKLKIINFKTFTNFFSERLKLINKKLIRILMNLNFPVNKYKLKKEYLKKQL